jgi:hypothetical protein
LTPHLIALSSAVCSAVATMLRGLRCSNFYAGFWINVAVGAVGLWSCSCSPGGEETSSEPCRRSDAVMG